ncbi:hypothetical protein niasHT_023902 [Heterodera trifolii]|uniref:Uncharacterized protein n=1 Tax=Heterodera trifolii TaxID=157864 RepID=A0ABD2JCV4_9BILA
MLPAPLVGFILLLGHFVFVSVGSNFHVLKKRGYDESESYSSEEEPTYKRHGYGGRFCGKRHRYPPCKGHRPSSYDGFPYGDSPLFPPLPQVIAAPPMPFSPLQLPSVSKTQGDLGALQVASPVLEGSPPKESPPLDASQPLNGATAIQSPAAAPETNVMNSLAASPPLAPPQQLASLWVGGRKKRSFKEPKTGKSKGRKVIRENEPQGTETTLAVDTEETTEKPTKKAAKEKPKQRLMEERSEKEAEKKKGGEAGKEGEQVGKTKKKQQQKEAEKQEKKRHRKEEEEEEEESLLGKKEQHNAEFKQGGPQFRSTWEER